ncbi:unnamed protein product [Sympodiomycopsis kandeliae]
MEIRTVAKASRIPGVARATLQLFIDLRETWDLFTVEILLETDKALQEIETPFAAGEEIINELDLVLEAGVPMLLHSVRRASDATAIWRKANVLSHWLKRHPKLSGVLTQQWPGATTQIAAASTLNCDTTVAERFVGNEEQIVGEAMFRLLSPNLEVRAYLCLWRDEGEVTMIRIGDGKAGLMGPSESRTGYFRAHLRWNARVGVVEVQVYDQVRWSPGLPLTDLFAAQFSKPVSFRTSQRTWHRT